jgi:hypothetical protein
MYNPNRSHQLPASKNSSFSQKTPFDPSKKVSNQNKSTSNLKSSESKSIPFEQYKKYKM